jgi:DNA-binding IclR family transcriptional regulator
MVEPPMTPFDLLTDRVTSEYREMPGLRLTFQQACRLWQIDPRTCEAVLTTLVESRVLRRTPDGSFVAWPDAYSLVRPIANRRIAT